MRLVTPKTFQAAWFFTILPCIFILGFDLAVPAQYPQTLVPLHSTRADVERIAKLTSASGDEVEFETDEEVLDIKFASSPCDRNGWNIPKDTVLSYTSIPKKKLAVPVLSGLSKVSIQGSDTGGKTISYLDKGMHLQTTADGNYIDRVLFSPNSLNSRLRCAGFPDYSALNTVSAPAQSMTVESVEKWDPGLLATPVFWVKEQNLRLQIFAYCERSKPQHCVKLRERALLLKRHLSASELQRFSVEIGGFRDKAEIEVFVLPANAPKLTPQPYYSSPWFEQGNAETEGVLPPAKNALVKGSTFCDVYKRPSKFENKKLTLSVNYSEGFMQTAVLSNYDCRGSVIQPAFETDDGSNASVAFDEIKKLLIEQQDKVTWTTPEIEVTGVLKRTKQSLPIRGLLENYVFVIESARIKE